MKKYYLNFIFTLIFSLSAISSYGQLPDFTLTVTGTNETCNRNGTLSFTVTGTHPDAGIIYTIYKLPNITTPYATVSNNSLSGLTGGTYRVIATQTLGTENNSKEKDFVINSTVTFLEFNMTFSNIACSLNRDLVVNVTSGNPVGYEIISGPIIKPRQTSNIFSNLIAGTYLIKVYDTCGNADVYKRQILDLPLGNTESKVAGIMVNLVGEEGHSGQVVYKNIEEILAIDGVTPHIYGKRETRPFRKMGHVTIVNEDIAKARKTAEEVKKLIRVISNS